MNPLLVFLIGAVCGGLGMVLAGCCVLAGREYPEQPARQITEDDAEVDEVEVYDQELDTDDFRAWGNEVSS